MISHRGISVITPLPSGEGKGEGPPGEGGGAAPINQKSCHPKGWQLCSVIMSAHTKVSDTKFTLLCQQ